MSDTTDQKVKVLVADDERPIRDGCQRVLTSRGYDVMLAEDGREALDIISRRGVDIVLLDLKMPLMGGEDVLEIVCTRHPDIPVIIITGHGTVDTAVACMKKGAYDFITKPFQVEQFLITVRRAAEKRKLEQRAKLFQEESARNLYDLHLEKSRVKTIIQCMRNGVMVTNRNLEVVLHNPALMRLMEVSGELGNPVPIRDILRDEFLIDTLRRILDSDPVLDEAIMQETSAGKNMLRALSAPLLAPGGNAVGTVTVMEDITPFKQLEQIRTDFVNMVVHELRSPLVSIKQMNSVILKGLAGPLAEKQEDFIGRGNRKIDTLLALINDLLDVAKIEAGQYVQRRVPTDIGKILEDTTAFMEPSAKEHGVVLTCSCSNLKSVRADPKSMEEIFNNLITNAINYSPGGGKVTVTATGMGEYIEVKIQDTGVGISPEELPKVFDRFYRVKHPKTRQVAGTGLGLAIVKGAVEAHHGTIDVESDPGKGTLFRILLPAIEE
ncbi:MAG: response regulator [Deltaproteobacteria bacterium]|nr:response regulator [Deltaproteobacteria bacterium]